MLRIKRILTGDITLKRMDPSVIVQLNVSMNMTVKYMNGQIRMKPKHVHGGRREFASMKKIIQVTTLNLCPAKNQVPCVLISRMVLNIILINHSNYLI